MQQSLVLVTTLLFMILTPRFYCQTSLTLPFVQAQNIATVYRFEMDTGHETIVLNSGDTVVFPAPDINAIVTIKMIFNWEGSDATSCRTCMRQLLFGADDVAHVCAHFGPMVSLNGRSLTLQYTSDGTSKNLYVQSTADYSCANVAGVTLTNNIGYVLPCIDCSIPPSGSPTNDPTEAPTQGTEAPTQETEAPTFDPSEYPTFDPSEYPTIISNNIYAKANGATNNPTNTVKYLQTTQQTNPSKTKPSNTLKDSKNMDLALSILLVVIALLVLIIIAVFVYIIPKVKVYKKTIENAERNQVDKNAERNQNNVPSKISQDAVIPRKKIRKLNECIANDNDSGSSSDGLYVNPPGNETVQTIGTSSTNNYKGSSWPRNKGLKGTQRMDNKRTTQTPMMVVTTGDVHTIGDC